MLRTRRICLASLGLVTLAALGPLGCSDETTTDDGGGSCDLLAGDLVITEIVADVDGQDKGLEWFEIYNASASPIDLEGRALVYSRVDGSGRKVHTVSRSVEIPPGGYVTVGSVLDDLLSSTPNLDYGYGEDLGEFGNGGGYLALGCGDQVVDEVYYVDANPIASRVFDGSQVPDAAANDFAENWCDSRTELSPGFAATPRATNDVCGSQSECMLGGQTVEVIHPAPGDLIITEIMANPELAGDDFGEWFEIRSLASAEFHLNGLDIGKALDALDDPDDTIAAAECVVIAPGSYAIVANNADAAQNGGLPPEAIVWETRISLSNSEGSLWLGLDGEILDAVTWTNAKAGEATQLDPDFSDPLANDELGNWCDAEAPYGLGDLGTPGAENLQCMIVPPDGQCYDGGELRDIVPVELGDLVITEFHPNPDAVDDAAGEWFEILAKGAGDLNGLEVGKAGAVADTIVAEDCISVSAGQYVVVAREGDAAVNGGLPQVDALFGMALNNTSSDLFIGYAGEIWDAVTYSSSTAGRSRSLGAGNFTTAANDDEAVWCDGSGVYGAGDQGTPGWENPACDGGPVTGMCVDPDTNMMRMVDPPQLGELQITEVMADPAAVLDADGEWFELHASAAFDLNGLQIGKAGAFDISVDSTPCIEIAADSWVLLARSGAQNGGLPTPAYVYDAGFSLNNSGGSLQVGYADAVLDETSWATSTAGTARSLDLMSMMWCPAVDPYGDGDLGTPAAANPACGGGMGMEGMCFDGQAWRDIMVPLPGDLAISEVMANPNAVADSAGEWFEIRALAGFDLNGLELGKLFADGPLETVDVSDCIALAPGDTALLANNADALTNGGLPPVDYEFSMSLTNSNSALHVAAAGVLLDEITWGTVGTGASTSLDPDSYDPNLNDMANNADPNWCYSVTVYGAGDRGTPKADNEECL